MSNNDALDIRVLSQEILYTPSMTAIQLIDELEELSKNAPVDGSFGVLVRSLIHEVHSNLKDT